MSWGEPVTSACDIDGIDDRWGFSVQRAPDAQSIASHAQFSRALLDVARSYILLGLSFKERYVFSPWSSVIWRVLGESLFPLFLPCSHRIPWFPDREFYMVSATISLTEGAICKNCFLSEFISLFYFSYCRFFAAIILYGKIMPKSFNHYTLVDMHIIYKSALIR